jgi:hypothetical protein
MVSSTSRYDPARVPSAMPSALKLPAPEIVDFGIHRIVIRFVSMDREKHETVSPSGIRILATTGADGTSRYRRY